MTNFSVRKEVISGKSAVEMQLEIVSEAITKLLSVKVSDLANKEVQKVLSEADKANGFVPEYLFTLPDGTITGSVEKVGDYFFELLLKDLLKVMHESWGVIQGVMAEMDKLSVEVINAGEGAMEA